MEKQTMRTCLLNAILDIGFSGYSFCGGGVRSSFPEKIIVAMMFSKNT